MKKIFLLLFIIFINSNNFLFAQSNSKVNLPSVINDSVKINPPLVLISKNYKDSVVLRWAPGSALLWKFANQYGYILKRLTIDSNKVPNPSQFVQLNENPILPLKLNEWKNKYGRTDTLAAVAVQILYGKHFTANLNKGVNLNDIMMQKADEDNRYGYAVTIADISPAVSSGLGLRWVDKTVVEGKSYIYMIYTLVPQKLIKSDTAFSIVNTNEPVLIPEMPKIRVEELDKAVRFNWNSKISRRYFSAYILERSDDGGKTYKRVNKIPIIQQAPVKKVFMPDSMTVTDSLSQNYKQYFYKITGITPYGDLGKPSPKISVMGRDKTPPVAPANVTAENIKNNYVKISWKKKIKEKDFKGYLIGRGVSMNGPFLPLFLKPLNKNVTQYIDTTAVQHGKNFYVVSALRHCRKCWSFISLHML